MKDVKRWEDAGKYHAEQYTQIKCLIDKYTKTQAEYIKLHAFYSLKAAQEAAQEAI